MKKIKQVKFEKGLYYISGELCRLKDSYITQTLYKIAKQNDVKIKKIKLDTYDCSFKVSYENEDNFQYFYEDLLNEIGYGMSKMKIRKKLF